MKFGRLFLLVMAMVVLTKPFIPVFFYLVNIDQITEYFCVNTDKPMLHCDGKCYLAKKMAEAREKQKSERAAADYTDLVLLQVDWIDRFKVDLSQIYSLTKNTYAHVNTQYNFNFFSSPFMPPKAA